MTVYNSLTAPTQNCVQLFASPFLVQPRKISFSRTALNLHLEPTFVALSHTKELSVCLGPIKHKLEEVQSKLNKCGLTHLIIKLITNNVHQEVRQLIDMWYIVS